MESVCQCCECIDEVTTVFTQSSLCQDAADLQFFHLKEKTMKFKGKYKKEEGHS